MLKDEVALYSQLTGRDGLKVPIGIIGAYIDGYERGKADAFAAAQKEKRDAEKEEW